MMNHSATARSARFSARVPGTGHFGRVVDDLDVVELGGEPRQLRPGDMSSSSAASAVGVSVAVRGGHDLAPSHSANPISPASPTVKATTPSDTGPIPPSGLPPGLL